jgi:hypothetical protein
MKITLADLRLLCPRGKADTLSALAAAFPLILPEYGITSGLRFCHFIAQAAHETMGFATLQELGGADYFERNYGPQTKVGQRLGNTQKGDGARFHGRGISSNSPAAPIIWPMASGSASTSSPIPKRRRSRKSRCASPASTGRRTASMRSPTMTTWWPSPARSTAARTG